MIIIVVVVVIIIIVIIGLPPPWVLALASLCNNPSIARPLLTAVSSNYMYLNAN